MNRTAQSVARSGWTGPMPGLGHRAQGLDRGLDHLVYSRANDLKNNDGTDK